MTNLIGAQICEASGNSSQISIVQIWNSSANTSTFNVKTLEVAWTAVASVMDAYSNIMGWDFDFGTVALGSTVDLRYLQSKNGSDTTAYPIELRNLKVAPPYPAARLVYEFWGGEAGIGRTCTFEDPIVLPPGTGLQIRPAQANVYNIVSVQGTLSS